MSSETRHLTHTQTLLQSTQPHIDQAITNAHHWTDTRPPTQGTRGGTTNPVSLEETRERYRVHALSVYATARIPELAIALDKLATELERLVTLLTATTNPERLPPNQPTCRSCARIGIHADVYEKSKTRGLCRWCYDYHQGTSYLPPIKALELYHRESPRAAGLWLARHSIAK